MKEPMTQDHKLHVGIQCMAHVGMANGLAGAVDAGKKRFKVFISERWARAAVPHVNFM